MTSWRLPLAEMHRLILLRAEAAEMAVASGSTVERTP
jgi:hypothetical protein